MVRSSGAGPCFVGLAALVLSSGCAQRGAPSRDGAPSSPPTGAAAGPLERPVSQSQTTPLPSGVEVTMAPDAIFVGARAVASITGSRVAESAKRDGPDGFFIDPLFQELKRALRTQKQLDRYRARRGRAPRAGQLTIRAHAALPVRILTEVIYTARQAEYRVMQLIVRQPSGRPMAIPLSRGLSTTTAPNAELVAVRAAEQEPAQAARAKRLARQLKEQLVRPVFATSGMLGVLAVMDLRAVFAPETPSSRSRDAWICRLLTPLPANRVYGLRLAVSASGKVERLAIAGPDADCLRCCLAPWLDSLMLPPGTKGEYLVTLALGAPAKDARPTLPTRSAMRPVSELVKPCRRRDLLGLTVELWSRGIGVHSNEGSECPGGSGKGEVCFPRRPGAPYREVVKELGRHLAYLHSTKYADPKHWNDCFLARGQISLVVHAGLTMQDFVAVADVARQRPTTGRRGAPTGCPYRFHPREEDWFVPPAQRAGCQFPHVTLGVR